MKELRDLCNGFVYNPQNSILYIHLPKEDKDGKIIPGEFNDISFADFVPKLKEYRITEDCNGNTLEEAIFQIEKDGRTLDGLYTVSKKILLSPIPFEPFPASCIVDHQVKGSFAMMRRCMQEEIKQTAPVRYYQFTGYKVIDGKRVFLNGENSVTAGGLTDKYSVNLSQSLKAYCFKAGKDEKRFDTLRKLFSVAPPSVIYPLLAYMFLLPLNTLLKEIHCSPSFALYIIGKTGTGKTAMAMLMLNFFGTFAPDDDAPASFSDTVNAVRAKAAQIGDSVLLLDDMIPDPDRVKDMEEAVLRMSGNHNGRNRADTSGALQDADDSPRCGTLITAEDAYQNVVDSAVARSIAIEISPGDVKLNDTLTELQHDAVHLNQCMNDYIQYILQHWDELKERLLPIFEQYRKEERSNGHSRLPSTVAHLRIGFETMCEWLTAAGKMAKEEAEERIKEATGIFHAMVKAQNERIKKSDGMQIWLDGLREMIDSGLLTVSNTDEKHYSNYLYRDRDFYYFTPNMYSKVKEYLEKQGLPVIRKTKLYRDLAEANIIEKQGNESTRAKSIGGKIIRCLYLRRTAIDREEEKSDA